MTETYPSPALRPVPPPSRVPWHVLAVVVGLTLGPLGLGELVSGLDAVVGGDEGGVPRTLAGAVLVGVVAAAAALRSSLALLCAGVAVVLAGAVGAATGVGVPALPVPLALGAGMVMVGGGGAAHQARRAGRLVEREERFVEDPSRPPRSRLRTHLARLVGSVVLVPVGVLLLGMDQPRDATHLGLVLLGAAIMCVVGLGAGASSLGAQVAGAGLVLVAVATEVLAHLTGRPLALPLDPPAAISLGLVLALSGLSAHIARRHGRALERAELELVR